MAVPRNRTSNAKKNSRRSHHAKKPKIAANCPNCGHTRVPHCVCSSCGHYNKRSIISSD